MKKWTGLTDLVAKLERAMPKVVEEAAELFAKKAQQLSPIESGEFKASIHVEAEGLTARVITTCDHAVDVEFGNHHQAPQAPLRSAFDATVEKAVDKIADGVNKTMK